MSETTKDKVMFGVSNLHVGLFTDDGNGNVTLGNPIKVPGLVNLTLEPDSEKNTFWADNVKYHTSYGDNGFTGEIEDAYFDNTFKTTFLGYITLADGGIAKRIGTENPKVYIMFQAEGDAKGRRAICYNVSFGQITREYATTEGSNNPATAKLPFSVDGDSKTKLAMVEYGPDTATYNSMFTTPPVPALPSASE